MFIAIYFQITKSSTGILKHSSNFSNGEFLLDKWKPWFIFGDYADQKHLDLVNHPIDYDAIKNNMRIDGLFNSELFLSLRVNGSVFQALTHYAGVNKIKLPARSYIAKPNYAKYVSDVNIGHIKDQDLTMNYHTDFAIGEWFWETENFLVTATTYMNDNYDGGEISFFVNGQIITYKPKAGDVLVFPSGSPLYAPSNTPYFHGVYKVNTGSKFLIRSYIRYPQTGNILWYKNVEKHGIEQWKKIAHDMSKGHNSLAFEYNDDKVEKRYKNISVWESPLVDFLYRKNKK